MKKRIPVLGFVILLVATAAYAAKVVPAYEATSLPGENDEKALWERASSHENRLRNAGTIFHDRHIEEYIEDLAARMLGDSIDHLGITMDFVLVEEPTLSAWAYPYGTIGLHTGLLVRMDNEAQFGAILAHEISHFLQRHTYREMLDGDKQSGIGKGLGFLAGLAIARETGTFDQGIMDFTGDLWENLATSGYSKKNEYVADEEGLELMARANLPIDQAIPAFQALAENSVYGAGDPRKMWSSHPRLEDRIKNLQKDIRKMSRKKGFVAAASPDPLDYYRGIAPALIMNARLDISELQFERARESLERYLLVHPDDPEAHYLVGETYRRSNPLGPDFTASQAAYRAALEYDSAFAPALKELGMTHRIQRQNDAAKQAFEEYLAHAGDAADAGIIRGYLEGL
jgi:beta-barrel assembly-enhancing protease